MTRLKSDTQASGVHLSDYSFHNRGKEQTVVKQYVCSFDSPNRDALCESSLESKELLNLSALSGRNRLSLGTLITNLLRTIKIFSLKGSKL